MTRFQNTIAALDHIQELIDELRSKIHELEERGEGLACTATMDLSRRLYIGSFINDASENLELTSLELDECGGHKVITTHAEDMRWASDFFRRQEELKPISWWARLFRYVKK